ncbi:unnamed protein product [Caenorhabditis brenneri]
MRSSNVGYQEGLDKKTYFHIIISYLQSLGIFFICFKIFFSVKAATDKQEREAASSKLKITLAHSLTGGVVACAAATRAKAEHYLIMSNYPKRIYVLPTPRPRGMAVPRVVPSLTPSPSPPQRQLKRVLQPVDTEQIVAELLGDDMGPSGPRKRERLNHLSQEEKMDRRKMKNRVAAQNARDKKKERSGKIDEVMRDLVAENVRLRAENEQLRRQNEELLLQQQQQQTQYIHTPCYTPEHNTATPTDENIYSNVVYEEEVVDEQQDGSDRRAVVVVEEEADQHAFESAVFINAPQPWDKANRSKSDNSNEDSHNVTTIAQLSNSPSKRGANGHHQEEQQLERIIDHLKTPSDGEFDQFVANYIEEGSHFPTPSSVGSGGSSVYSAPSETCETFSTASASGSLALSPSMSSNGSCDWNDDFFNDNAFGDDQQMMPMPEEDPDALIDPGNWNFESFDDSDIDLNFFQ